MRRNCILTNSIGKWHSYLPTFTRYECKQAKPLPHLAKQRPSQNVPMNLSADHHSPPPSFGHPTSDYFTP
ncbi:hypothetical protein COCNU_01G017750 [Cocos nucifera]|uniref:Uncharacterized protein n=1 Tax=Cocos nucifera TaxID=13894 RepID=A0A8K0HWM4_COCNU|nr:hypothetical protein COCNU_01G017750 [Cocos nucifera]